MHEKGTRCQPKGLVRPCAFRCNAKSPDEDEKSIVKMKTGKVKREGLTCKRERPRQRAGNMLRKVPPCTAKVANCISVVGGTKDEE